MRGYNANSLCAESGRGFGLSRDHDCKQDSWRNNVQRFFTMKHANTRDPEFLRMRISKKQSEYCQEIALRVEYSNDIAREFYISRET